MRTWVTLFMVLSAPSPLHRSSVSSSLLNSLCVVQQPALPHVLHGKPVLWILHCPLLVLHTAAGNRKLLLLPSLDCPLSACCASLPTDIPFSLPALNMNHNIKATVENTPNAFKK